MYISPLVCAMFLIAYIITLIFCAIVEYATRPKQTIRTVRQLDMSDPIQAKQANLIININIDVPVITYDPMVGTPTTIYPDRKDYRVIGDKR